VLLDNTKRGLRQRTALIEKAVLCQQSVSLELWLLRDLAIQGRKILGCFSE
jgi:hypothetical protein